MTYIYTYRTGCSGTAFTVVAAAAAPAVVDKTIQRIMI